MKKLFYAAIPFSVFLVSCSPVIYTNNPRPAYRQPVQDDAGQQETDQVFYDQLSPYGQWIDYPDYGYVWQPNVDADFRPYVTNGSWVYSDYGWTWASDYSWGWAPFHYGNWFYDDSYGWLWVPGNEWAPAWVNWGQSGDYYGWAPVPPRGNGNSAWRPGNGDWNYVHASNMTEVNVNRYVVRNNITVINNTTIINNTTNQQYHYNRGPQVNDVENIGHTKIQQVKINGSVRPGQSLANNQFNIYRPVIKQNAPQGNIKPAPQNVINYKKGNNQNQARQNQRPANNQSSNQQQNQKPGNKQNPSQRQNQMPGNNQNPNQHQMPGNNQNPNQQQNQKPENSPNYSQQQNQRPGSGGDSSRRQGGQKTEMGQNPNMQYISRPVITPSNNNQPKPQNPNQAKGQGGNQHQNPPQKTNNKKAGTSKPNAKKIMTPPPVKQN
jgi:hypothetical protein